MAVSRLQVAGYPRSWNKYTWIMWQKGETRHRGRRGFSQQLRVSGFHPCPLWVLRENGYRPPIRLVFHSGSATLAVDPVPQSQATCQISFGPQLYKYCLPLSSSTPKFLFILPGFFFFFFLALLMQRVNWNWIVQCRCSEVREVSILVPTLWQGGGTKLLLRLGKPEGEGSYSPRSAHVQPLRL